MNINGRFKTADEGQAVFEELMAHIFRTEKMMSSWITQYTKSQEGQIPTFIGCVEITKHQKQKEYLTTTF